MIDAGRARVVFGVIAFMLILGHLDMQILSILYKLNYEYWDYKYCNVLNLIKENIGVFIEMLMPYIIGMFVLYTLNFIT